MMRDDRSEDKPPFSRLFIVCSKHHTEEDLKPLFEAYGDIDELHMPKDRKTNESKGIAYIKYKKTSSAAAAIESLHMKHIQNSNKPIKVMVSSNKNEEKNDNDNKYKRLFIKVPKDTKEKEIRDHFSRFGRVVGVRLQRNKETSECKGFGYVNYNTFLEAAMAYEECDKNYKPVFAIPKEDLKRSRSSGYDNIDKYPSNDSLYMREYPMNDMFREHNSYREHNQREDVTRRDCIMPLIRTEPRDFDTISVICSPYVAQKPIERLFNIIPGMIQFNFTPDTYNGICKAVIKYETKVAAAHAVEMLHNYEFPSGELISVKPDDNPLSKVANNLTNIVNSFKNSLNSSSDLLHLADAIAQASSLIKAATCSTEIKDIKTENNDSVCSVRLPPVKPMASVDSRVAQRCFIVFRPHTLPANILRDAFCRFGDLIEVTAMSTKTYGFAKYASIRAAQEAMKTLNGAILHGVRLKVIEAEEKPNREEKSHDNEIESHATHSDYMERKRLKLENVTLDM